MRTMIIALVLLLVCAACSPAAPPAVINDLPEGDPVAGEALFHNAIGAIASCESCHSLDGSRKTGPSLQGFGATAASRPGDDALNYAANSIVNPGAYVVSGYSNIMPASYGQLLSRQQLADLLAFLLTL